MNCNCVLSFHYPGEHGSQSIHAFGVLDYVPDLFGIVITQELASKLPPSKPRNGGPVFCVFTRYWSTVAGFAVWEVGCLRADFNAFGRVCHRCVHRATSFKA